MQQAAQFLCTKTFITYQKLSRNETLNISFFTWNAQNYKKYIYLAQQLSIYGRNFAIWTARCSSCVVLSMVLYQVVLSTVLYQVVLSTVLY
jgi:hypothetical protein